MANGKLSLVLLHFANRVRRLFGRPMKPKRCCRNLENRGPWERIRPDLTVCRCRVCNCQHFELNADPRHFGLVG